MRFDFSQFLTSVTGVISLSGTALLITKKYNLAASVFTALTIGSLGVAWERYSRKAGEPLSLRVFSKKRLPDQQDREFIFTHSPYLLLAAASWLLAKRAAK